MQFALYDVILQMNFLAHAFLSFDHPHILTGNMISDFVKGKRKFDYPLSIQNGISLHRQIDDFTDFHPATARAKNFFRADYRLYSGAFVDIVFDHFLAVDKNQFPEKESLENFTRATYNFLEKNSFYFPLQFQKIFPYMKNQNWLLGYHSKEGIRKAFGGLADRALYFDESDIAFQIFNDHYKELQNCYEEFFPQLKQFSLKKLRNLLAE
jgi:acyl carrier protein phosphodiesterase